MAIDVTKPQLEAGLKQVSVPSDVMAKVQAEEKTFKKAVSDYGSSSLKYKIRKEPDDVKEQRLKNLYGVLVPIAYFISLLCKHFKESKGVEKIEKINKDMDKKIKELEKKNPQTMVKSEDFIPAPDQPDELAIKNNWKNDVLTAAIGSSDGGKYIVEVQAVFNYAYGEYESGYKKAREHKESMKKKVTGTLRGGDKLSIIDNEMFEEEAKSANRLLKMYKSVHREIVGLLSDPFVASNPDLQKKLNAHIKKINNEKLTAKLENYEKQIKGTTRRGKYAGQSEVFKQIDFFTGKCAEAISGALKSVSGATTSEARKKGMTEMVTRSTELLEKVDGWFKKIKTDALPNQEELMKIIEEASNKLSKEKVKLAKGLGKLEAKMGEFSEAMDQYKKDTDPKRKALKLGKLLLIAGAITAGIAAGLPAPAVLAVTSSIM